MRKKFLIFIFFILTSCSAGVYVTGSYYTPSAGSYFPDKKEELERVILKALSSSDKIVSYKNNRHLFGIISPHAGYNYSGSVAGEAYKRLIGKENLTAIIISNSHYYPIDGISIYPAGSFKTPLGEVNIDSQLSLRLMKSMDFIRFYPQSFEREHPIDTQIPFLQMTIKNLKILPLVIGRINEKERNQLISFLKDLILSNPDKYLIVASSDMSHYHNYQRAEIMDHTTIKKIKELDVDELSECLFRKNCELCGYDAVIILMELTKILNGRVEFLKYLNSGDTVGNKERVVGYSAFAFYLNEDNPPLTTAEKKTLLKIARKTLERYITSSEIPDLVPDDNRLLKKGAVFITLKKNGIQRGCMGTLESNHPLYLTVSEMTIQASTRDPRYKPLRENELKDISLEISYIEEVKEIKNLEEIEIGKHGIHLCKGLNCATFLPQVAIENNWDRDEFLRRLSIKAGLSPSAYKDKDTKIYIFSAQVFSEEQF